MKEKEKKDRSHIPSHWYEGVCSIIFQVIYTTNHKQVLINTICDINKVTNDIVDGIQTISHLFRIRL